MCTLRLTGLLLLASFAWLACGGDGEPSSDTQDVAAAPKIVCSMKRLASIAPGERVTEIDLKHVTADEPGISESLGAFEGFYSFDVTRDGDFLNVTFSENEHVQDEVGSFGCDVPPRPERGVVFCQEPLVIDASLGTDADERRVHAFDFSCRVE